MYTFPLQDFIHSHFNKLFLFVRNKSRITGHLVSSFHLLTNEEWERTVIFFGPLSFNRVRFPADIRIIEISHYHYIIFLFERLIIWCRKTSFVSSVCHSGLKYLKSTTIFSSVFSFQDKIFPAPSNIITFRPLIILDLFIYFIWSSCLQMWH